MSGAGRRRGVLGRLRAVPHLFSKLVVLWCVGCGTICSLYAMRILSRTGQDPAALLGVILAFFGGELGLMFGKNALEGKRKTREGSSSDAVPGDSQESESHL